MSNQELSKNEKSWDDFEKMLEEGRKEVEDIDPRKHILNKMSISSGGVQLFEDERKDEFIK